MFVTIFAKTGLIGGVGTVQLLVPGINITGVQLVYFIIAVVIAAYVHELLHALTAVAHGLKVKSMGFIILFIIPLAFTEVDEEEISRASVKSKVAVLSAGPSSNYVLALFFLLILYMVVSPSGIVVRDVAPNGLAEEYGLKPNDIILKINDEPATPSVLAKYLNNRSALNFTITVLSSGVVREIHIYKPENVTRLGISYLGKPSDYLIQRIGLENALALQDTVIWLHIVNLGLAVINAAPIFISDGGRIFYEITKNKNIGHAINSISFLILILALTPL